MAARKTASKAISVAPKGKDLASIDDALSSEISAIKSRIGQPSSNRIKIEAAGRFTLADGQDLGDEIQCVVVDFVARNNFYLTAFDKDNISPPDCYAIGTVRHDLLVPEDDSPDRQAETCAACPQNVWGSDKTGRGKACSNRYLVCVLLVDENNPDAHNEPDAPLYVLDLSPSNLRSFDGFVSGVARSLNGPPIKAIVTVIAQNVGTYAKVTWAEPLANPDYATHYARREEADDILRRKPDFSAVEAAPTRGRRAATPASRKPAARRTAPSGR